MLSLSCYGQANPDLGKFSTYFFKNHKLPLSVKQDCRWNYAVVSLKTNKKDQVTRIDFVNSGSDSLRKSFDFLKGYQFEKKLKINQRPVVFIFMVEQLGGLNAGEEGCKTPVNEYTPTQIAERILTDLAIQREKEPNAIIKYNPLVTVVGGWRR